jgi:hypothetical protein
MEAAQEFEVKDMHVTVTVDVIGSAVHKIGPQEWHEINLQGKSAQSINIIVRVYVCTLLTSASATAIALALAHGMGGGVMTIGKTWQSTKGH